MAMELFWFRWAATALSAVVAGCGCVLVDEGLVRIAMGLAVIATHVILIDAEKQTDKQQFSP